MNTASINIKGYIYAVQKVTYVGEDLLAECDYKCQTIKILDGLSKRQERQTLIHELAHAYMWVYGFSEWTISNEAMCNFIGVYADSIVRDTNLLLGELT